MGKIGTLTLDSLKDSIRKLNNTQTNPQIMKVRNFPNPTLHSKPYQSEDTFEKRSQNLFTEKKTPLPTESMASDIKTKTKDKFKKHVVIGKTSCDACKQQKNILEKRYLVYSLDKAPRNERKEGKEFKLNHVWSNADKSIEENKRILLKVKRLHDKKKMSDDEYNEFKKKIADSIITAENMLTDKYEEIRNAYEFKYVDDKDPEKAKEAKDIFQSYGGIAYPLLPLKNCRAKKTADGRYSRAHCKVSANTGVNGLIEFHMRESGEDVPTIINTLEDMLKVVQKKYNDEDDASQIVNEVIQEAIITLENEKEGLKPLPEKKELSKSSKKSKQL